jgi:hypothetical protein
MHRRVVSPLVALALAAAACGDAFTAATNDGGTLLADAASFDTGAAKPDGSAGDDAATGADATSHDAASEDGGGHGKGDGSIGNLDSGPVLPDGSVCARTCPAGFNCFASQCQDRAALHFSPTDDHPGNWAYGYAVSQGASFQLDSSHWTGSSIDVWTNTAANVFEPSVFHNSGLLPQMVSEMTIPGEALGLFPGATGQPSIVRWIPPATGFYAIDATFTGISTPLTTVTVEVVVNNITGPSQALNAFGGGNTYTYSAPAQTLTAGDTVDFYVIPIANRDDSPGGTELDARITAE